MIFEYVREPTRTISTEILIQPVDRDYVVYSVEPETGKRPHSETTRVGEGLENQQCAPDASQNVIHHLFQAASEWDKRNNPDLY